MNAALTALGLSHHPFDPDVPLRALTRTPATEFFCRRVGSLAKRGGFALLTGAPGTGKSVALRLLRDSLLRAGPEHTVTVLERPHASVADFYREIGHLYGVPLTPHNRWAGASRLRKAWRDFAQEACLQAVLIIDEAQEMFDAVLAELRLLAGEQLDAGWLLTVVLCGDDRLPERLATATLAPLANRIRVRVHLEEQAVETLEEVLMHQVETAGNPAAFAPEVIRTLAEQAGGNLRSLMHLADQALSLAIDREATVVDQEVLLAAAESAQQQRHPGARTGQRQAVGRRP